MPYKNYGLPEYHLVTDMWEELKNETRPIMVYGMGNGADKLFERFASFGIQVSEVFASDGFVRFHSFGGYKVRSFSEIKEKYPSFVIVLSFASNRAEVIDMLSKIDSEYDMYAPDMPVAAVEEYFDKDFYNSHYDEIVKAYESLADDKSRDIYSSIINYKLSGRIKYLLECFSEKDEIYSLLDCQRIKVCVDAGAYNGDTAREMLGYFPNVKHIYAIEPDRKNFKKLARYSEAEEHHRVIPINAAVWNEDTAGAFFGSGNRNSTAVATASYQHSEDEVQMLKIDSLGVDRVDYIKYDVEGAEREAILGSHETITRNYPELLISLYHRSRDIFELINSVTELYPKYALYLRRLRCLPAWEIDLICVNDQKGNI